MYNLDSEVWKFNNYQFESHANTGNQLPLSLAAVDQLMGPLPVIKFLQ